MGCDLSDAPAFRKSGSKIKRTLVKGLSEKTLPKFPSLAELGEAQSASFFIPSLRATVQPVDFTTLTAICADLQREWLPARLEQVYQRDRDTLCLALRTLKQRGWLTLSWHPQAARLCIGEPPPRTPDTFTLSQQIRHQIGNLALVAIEPVAPWERALDLQFARRPGESALWHLYLEVMGQYSNLILTNQDNQIVTVAYQVSAQQSRLRSLLTGQPYELPPSLTNPSPSLSESYDRWQQRLALVPDTLKKSLLKNYRGLSSVLVQSLVESAELTPEQSTETLKDADWRRLYDRWQAWLTQLDSQTFQPGWTAQGYTVTGWGITEPVSSIQTLIHQYYRDQINQQAFSQLRHQLLQKLRSLITRLQGKVTGFRDRLQQSDRADEFRAQADLLMAHLHQWEPGMTRIELPDFETGAPVAMALDPTKNAVQNAQALYKQHQKLKRARGAVEPLLSEAEAEMHYLEQVDAAVAELAAYETPDDLTALQEIREELIQQGYLEDPDSRSQKGDRAEESQPYRYTTPNGLEVLVGRNNQQNDRLTFRQATDYDLWFHTQEIPGSHVLLRMAAGVAPDTEDLQFAANLAAYHSRGRQSDQVPVVYTQPKHVYKPKGAKPGMTIYKHEQVIWGQPQQIRDRHLSAQTNFVKKI